MKLGKETNEAVRNLGDAINKAVEKSPSVRDAIESLRDMGFEPNLLLKLEIELHEIVEEKEEFPNETELDLTDEDLRTLQKMKIRF
ncbi:hypothetical protein BH10ACI1_BH10ACI1_16430 [soil metagenome]